MLFAAQLVKRHEVVDASVLHTRTTLELECQQIDSMMMSLLAAKGGTRREVSGEKELITLLPLQNWSTCYRRRLSDHECDQKRRRV